MSIVSDEWKRWAVAIAGAPVVVLLAILWFLSLGHIKLITRILRLLRKYD